MQLPKVFLDKLEEQDVNLYDTGTMISTVQNSQKKIKQKQEEANEPNVFNEMNDSSEDQLYNPSDEEEDKKTFKKQVKIPKMNQENLLKSTEQKSNTIEAFQRKLEKEAWNDTKHMPDTEDRYTVQERIAEEVESKWKEFNVKVPS